MPTPRIITRRQLLTTAMAAAAGVAAPTILPRGARASAPAAPRTKVRLGFIGVGQRGLGHVQRTIRRPDVEVPAICDIDANRLAHALQVVEQSKGKKPEGYSAGEEDKNTGHNGMDFFIDHAFVESVKRRAHPPIDTWDTATWSAIIALSEQSHARGSAPVEFPDFTEGKWATNPRIFGLNEEY